MAEGPHSYLPTEGLTYDPSDANYWDADALQGEIRRVFEVCHGCRMCFKYCDSFPDLFQFIDERHDGDVGKVTPTETQHVMDQCFQCKLCDVQCPYTPRDDHEFQLDFPRLVHRFQAQRARKEGVPWSRKFIADADKAGAMARASMGLANTMNRVAIHRWFMEKLIGIDRRKLLPDFAASTFDSQAQAEELASFEVGGEAVLFQTCYIQNNEPEIGRDTLEVYAKHRIDMRCAKGLECCGMPFWETGDLDEVRKRAHHNLDILEPFIDAGAKVVAINPTCAMMMRRE
ncbi:MAG: glycerol-3-phosphate dehydrogenase subunit C, partial [Myxococcota bacterium]